MKNKFLLFCGFMLLSNVAAASTEVQYTCKKGSKILVIYDDNKARVILNNRIYMMKSAMSASGARYIGGGYTWWTKADKGSIYRGTDLNTMKRLDDCIEK